MPDALHPATLPRLIGREQEAGEALRLVRGGVRLLTLTGPGGVGKTRLALHLAEQLACEGNVFFIPLATVDDPALLPPARHPPIDRCSQVTSGFWSSQGE